MRITFVLQESICDCRLQITDSQGTRLYYISALTDDQNTSPTVTAEIFDASCDLTLIPTPSNTDAVLNEFEDKNWKDKLVKKASKALFDTLDRAFLRVGCKYPITGLQDGDHLNISMQTYVFGTFDRFDLLGLLPLLYVFFEVSKGNRLFKLDHAYPTNRKDVLKFAKILSLTDLLSYPLQVGRIKQLTKNKKVSKTLVKFSNMSDAERQKFLEKQDKFLNH